MIHFSTASTIPGILEEHRQLFGVQKELWPYDHRHHLKLFFIIFL